jgi:imidazolonepropionase
MDVSSPILTGPFKQLLTMQDLPLKGALQDDQLVILQDAGILTDQGRIIRIASFKELYNEAIEKGYVLDIIEETVVGIPGLIDAHTHICWAGNRSGDYAMRMAGKSYQEIAASGGGIWDTVTKTRAASAEDLQKDLEKRTLKLLHNGITTVEVKSGYCLNVEGEVKMLEVINKVNDKLAIDLVSSCLAAHILPKDFNETPGEYLDYMARSLLLLVKAGDLARRVDIFVEENAFSVAEATRYLKKAKSLGFDLVVHADQFTTGGSKLAVELGAVSADHLEVSTQTEIELLAKSNVVPVALPGASLGLGYGFMPARKFLDAGTSLAIASDWNPGSAPMGDLLVQAAVLGAYEKLTMAETLAAITFRAAAALRLNEIGILMPGKKADIIAFELENFREILYHQGSIKPEKVWKNGVLIY